MRDRPTRQIGNKGRYAVRRWALLVAATVGFSVVTNNPSANAASSGTTASSSSILTVSSGNCAWPVESDPALLNAAFPDTDATYFASILPALPDETLTISGEFPHARYISFTTYDALTSAVDNLNDVEIVPNPGNTNPFLLGADRQAVHRSYSLTVVFGRRPAHGPANRLYTTSEDGTRKASAFLILYRIYLPDNGLNVLGGVSLPVVTVNLPDHTSVPLPPCPSVSTPAAASLNKTIADIDLPYPTIPFPGSDPPVWHKVTSGDVGFFNNLDNSYMTTLLGRGYGDVVIIRGRLPSFPDTDAGEAVMTGGQLRYWSMCTNEEYTERVWACLADYQMVVNSQREYTVVVSTSSARPSNATARCGINWLPWGAAPDSLVIMRNMLPSPNFTQSVQNATAGHEPSDMGPYYPSSQYTTTAAVESLGCPS